MGTYAKCILKLKFSFLFLTELIYPKKSFKVCRKLCVDWTAHRCLFPLTRFSLLLH